MRKWVRVGVAQVSKDFGINDENVCIRRRGFAPACHKSGWFCQGSLWLRSQALTPSKNLKLLKLAGESVHPRQVCCTSAPSLTSRAFRRHVCASLAEMTDRALLESTRKAPVAKVPLGAFETLRGTGVVHVLPWSMQRRRGREQDALRQCSGVQRKLNDGGRAVGRGSWSVRS